MENTTFNILKSLWNLEIGLECSKIGLYACHRNLKSSRKRPDMTSISFDVPYSWPRHPAHDNKKWLHTRRSNDCTTIEGGKTLERVHLNASNYVRFSHSEPYLRANFIFRSNSSDCEIDINFDSPYGIKLKIADKLPFYHND